MYNREMDRGEGKNRWKSFCVFVRHRQLKLSGLTFCEMKCQPSSLNEEKEDETLGRY